MSHDIAIGTNMTLPTGAPISKKPPYLILWEAPGVKVPMRFISLDKPQNENGFVQVKGFHCDKTEVQIIKSFSEILTDLPKELIVEMMFPIHRIVHIQNLIFNAVKAQSGR